MACSRLLRDLFGVADGDAACLVDDDDDAAADDDVANVLPTFGVAVDLFGVDGRVAPVALAAEPPLLLDVAVVVVVDAVARGDTSCDGSASLASRAANCFWIDCCRRCVLRLVFDAPSTSKSGSKI